MSVMRPGGLECVDIHTHVVPERFPPYLGSRVGTPWPSTEPAHVCHRHVMISGRVYRTVSDQCWDVNRRVEAMAAQGVSRQVLSPMPELLSYWLDPDDGAALCRYLNDEIAAMVRETPARFVGLGCVPLQDVDRAIGELEFLVRELGLSGVEIGTNVNEVPLGDPRLEPFFAAAEAIGAAIFVHPLRPAGKERLVGPKGLEQLLAFPGETGLAAASLITSGTLDRHPGLRIAFSHGGGTLSSLLPRLQHGWQCFDGIRESMPRSPAEQARAMYYDSLVYDDAMLLRILDCFGDTQVCVGSDFPFAIGERDPVGRIDALALDASRRERLLDGNARRWLGLTH